MADNEPKPKPNRFRLMSIGTELLGAVVGGTALGWYIDYKFQTSPYGVLIGSSVGILGGLYNVIKQYLVYTADEQRTRQSHRPLDGSH